MVRRSGKTKMGTRTNTVEHREEKGGKKQKKREKERNRPSTYTTSDRHSSKKDLVIGSIPILQTILSLIRELYYRICDF